MHNGFVNPISSARPATSKEDAWEKLLIEIVDAISVPASDYVRINSHYEAIGEILSEPRDRRLADGHIFPQGSFLTHTVVRAVSDGEIDVDAILLLKDVVLAPRELLEALHTELYLRARTQGGVERRNRCVTVTYADSVLPAHLDLTPAIASEGNSDEDGFGPLEVPDYEEGQWHPTNPRDFARWFNAVSELPILVELGDVSLTEAQTRAETEPLPSHEAINAFDPLRASVKLMKRHRDLFRQRQREGAPVPISVLITTLAAKAYIEVAELSKLRPLTALQAMREVIARMPNQFDQYGTSSEEWILKNPPRPTENFAEKWNRDPSYAAMFSEWHRDLSDALDLGLKEFRSKDLLEERISDAFGREARRRTSGFLLEQAALGNTLPGIDDPAADRLRKASSVGTTLRGLALSEPKQPAQPKSLDRLG